MSHKQHRRNIYEQHRLEQWKPPTVLPDGRIILPVQEWEDPTNIQTEAEQEQAIQSWLQGLPATCK